MTYAEDHARAQANAVRAETPFPPFAELDEGSLGVLRREASDLGLAVETHYKRIVAEYEAEMADDFDPDAVAKAARR